MTGDNDRALDDWRLHCLSPFSTRTGPSRGSPCSEIMGCDAQHRFSLFDNPTRQSVAVAAELSGGKAAARSVRWRGRNWPILLKKSEYRPDPIFSAP
jgi:hypothetical protein